MREVQLQEAFSLNSELPSLLFGFTGTWNETTPAARWISTAFCDLHHRRKLSITSDTRRGKGYARSAVTAFNHPGAIRRHYEEG